MQMQFSHAWTSTQKALIVVSALLAIGVVSTAVYTYERYHRGPGEDALYGTWQDPDYFEDDLVYFQFRPDRTFFIADTFQGELNPFVGGTWFAGGPHIYLRFFEDPFEGRRPTVAHIVRISGDEITIRWYREPDRKVTTWKKTSFPLLPRDASNQAMQLTAGSLAICL